MPTAALGILARLGIGDSPGPATIGLDFQSETLSLQETVVNIAGLRGTVARPAARNRVTEQMVRGNIVLDGPTPVEMAGIFKYIFGGSPSGTSYPLAETLPAMAVVVRRSANKMFTYPGVLVDRAAFSARPGGALSLTLDVAGTTEVEAAASGYPSLTLDTTTSPFIFADTSGVGGALTVNGVTADNFSFDLQISNGVNQRRVNSLAPTLSYRTDRIITLRLDAPYGDVDTSLYGLAVGGVPVVITFSYLNTALTFSLPKVTFSKKSPDVTGRDELHLPLDGTAGYNATPGDECVVTLDSTP